MIVAVNVGKAEVHKYGDRSVRTAAHKQRVDCAYLRTEGFEGDEQADRRHHGGPDKAVCVYSAEHYGFWRDFLGCPLEHGAFGENLTVIGVLEAEICVGDVFRAGDAVVQVTQPRQPCGNLAARHRRPDLVATIQKNGFTGFYLRVIEAGLVRTADLLVLSTRDPAAVSIQFANRVMHRQLPDPESLQRLLAVPALSQAWRESLERRLT